MGKFKDFSKNIIKQVWEGFLKNIGVIICVFIFTGGYLAAINKINEFRLWIRAIPTDYVLTPAVLLLVGLGLLVYINRKQKQRLTQLLTEPDKNEHKARFVTHLGVWWKIYPDVEYIEDFPYCPCCDPHMKLAQTEWLSEEKYKCSKTNTEYKLYGHAPMKRLDVVADLYKAYFQSFRRQDKQRYYIEMEKIKELNPGISNRELTEKLFKLKPFSNIPSNELKEILNINDHPQVALHFVERNYLSYKKYFKSRLEEENNKR